MLEVEHKRTKQLEQILISRGVGDFDLLRQNANYDLADALVKVEVDIPNIIQKPLTAKKQYEAAVSIFANPIRGRYVLGISSFPTDARAKQVAICIMRNAITMQMRKKIKFDYPLYHRVYGTHKDELRDAKNTFPMSMLILSNINTEASGTKVEKVRDLLERYSNIPRIVVLGGVDPITFFTTRLNYPLTACLQLGPANRIRT